MLSFKLVKKVARVIAAVALAGTAYFTIGKVSVPAYDVARVIDGDSFETKEKQLIRLADVNAPELKYCGGPEAKAALEKLILNKPLYIKVIYRDNFFRLISYVWTKNEFVNQKLVEQGVAIYRVSGKRTTESKILHTVSEKARARNLGLYGHDCTQLVNPTQPTCNIKANFRGGNSGLNYYHVVGCGQYNNTEIHLYEGDRWFCTENEAKKAGFVKAPLCS